METGISGLSPSWNWTLVLGAVGSVGVFVLWTSLQWFTSESALAVSFIAFVILATWPIIRDIRTHRFDLFEARYLFVFFFALYVIPLPLFSLLSRQSASFFVSSSAISEALFLCLLGLAAFYLGYRMSWGTRLAALLPRLKSVSESRLRKSALVALAAILLVFCIFLFQVGGLRAYLEAGYSGLYQIEEGHEHFAFAMNVFPACLLLLYHVAVRNRMRWQWAGGAMVALLGFSALFALMGRRRTLLSLMLGFLIYRHYAQKRMSAKLAATVLIIGVLATSVLGLIRAIPLQAILSTDVTSELSQNDPQEYFYAFLENGEFSVTFESFPLIIDASRAGLPHTLGSSYLGTFRLLIPKVFDPNRPPTAAQWYAQTFFPGVALTLGGRAFFFLAEAYLSFGALGPICLMFLAGVGCRLAYSFLLLNNRVPESALLYAAVMSNVPSGIRIDFATLFKACLVASVPLLVIVIWYSSRRNASSGGTSSK